MLIDLAQLESAVLNLVINARDAMPNGGEVTLAVKSSRLEKDSLPDENIPSGDYVAVSVSDTGVGMSTEVRDKAFEPFFTTKEVGAGSGLGLSQVHGFIRQSAGYIRMESTENVGTTITLYLPRVAS